MTDPKCSFKSKLRRAFDQWITFHWHFSMGRIDGHLGIRPHAWEVDGRVRLKFGLRICSRSVDFMWVRSRLAEQVGDKAYRVFWRQNFIKRRAA